MSQTAIDARRRPPLRFGLLVGALGVVYGDIGTSPLYAFKASLEYFKAGISDWEILGVLSMMFWTLILIVTVKYVFLVMRADNRGEGGILALMALAQRVSVKPHTKYLLAVVGLVGTCLFFGDGAITPAISVLSAMEGLEVAAPSVKEYVLPLSAIVIIGLFLVQYRGTGQMGRVFGPVLAVWFVTIGGLGLAEVVRHPHIMLALSPTYAAWICIHYKALAFMALGAVVLTVTGAEALYADMGHFGARPIRIDWLFFVLPALVLNYFGQGALMMHDARALANPFYLLAPSYLQLPLVVLANAATVIASQAVISGAFSLARQCMQLGFLPRLVVHHTSATEAGQIYLPQVNYGLALAVLVLVVTFKTSESLASAYGIAVTGTFICTAILAMVVYRRQFKWSRAAVVVVFGFFLLLDCCFYAANMLKILEGGWVPLAIGLTLIVMMTTWSRGRELLLARWRQDSLPMASFLTRLPQSRTIRVPGTAVFLTANPDYLPGALLHNLKHNKVLHERVVFVTVTNLDVPEVAPEQRGEVTPLAEGIYRVMLRYGFMESPNIPRALEALRPAGLPYDPMQVSYFLGRETLVPAIVPKLPFWRLWLFLVMARNAVSATEFFGIPSDRVVELGVRVAI